MRLRFALPAILLLTASAVFADTPPPATGPWDVRALQAVDVKPTWGPDVPPGKAREVYYLGEPYQGKLTRVFAYYARPAGSGRFPGVLLVHGGGGKAFSAWTEHWAGRGYCALAMDLAGNGPSGRLKDGGPDLKAAVPVYGCGFLHENSAWKESRLDTMAAERRTRWVDAFDPSRRLPGVRCPILFLNGTNDFAYPLDSYRESYQAVKVAPVTLAVRVRPPHGHIWTFGEVDAFIDPHLKGGEPLPTVGPLKRDGAAVSATVASKVGVKSAELCYAMAEGPWQKREWKTASAEVRAGTMRATLPTGRPLVYYLSATDPRGLVATTAHEEVAAGR